MSNSDQNPPIDQQRSPIPSSVASGHGDPSQMPPQIMVPKSDSQGPHSIPQHSPAGAQRLQRPMSGQPVAGWPPVDPNDPNSQQHPGAPPQYAPPQMMAQPGQQLHNYPQGMGPPPPGYWPPQPQRYGYPGGDPSMQPPMHIPGPHPYYLQVPPQHHVYGGQPKMEGGFQNGPNDPQQAHMQPAASTAQSIGSQEDEEAKRRLQQQPNMHLSPAAYPPQHQSQMQNQPQQLPPGMHRPPMHPSQMMPPHHMPGQPQPLSQIPPYIPTPYTHLLKPAQKEAVEKLVGVPSEFVPHHTIPQRREFFEQLVLLNNEQGEQLTAPPQVSKSAIDLHRLYIAVRKKGGFENVTKDKSWKALCPEANPRMTESSAAGYQLRRHYQKYLLFLECRETGRNFEDLKLFAEKLKKKKKEKEPGVGEGPSTPVQASSTAGPPTPNSIRSAATPTPQHSVQQPPQPSPSTYPNGPPHHHYPGIHGPPPPGHPAYVGPSDPQAAAYYYQQQQSQHAAAMAQQNQQGMPPPPTGWPGAYPPGNYGPPQMRGPPYYPGQPHQQQPATSMEYQPHQQNLGPGSAQPPINSDRPSSSMSGAAGTQASRPPSQAPPSVSSSTTHNLSHQPPPSTPDNRTQALGDADRPSSRQPPAGHRPGHTPTPTSAASANLGQPPPQAPLGQIPPPNSQNYYGPPGTYPPRMPPQAGSQSAKSPYPAPGAPFQGMEPPNFIQPQHHPSMYQMPPGQHQPGMWPPPHHPAGVPPSVQMSSVPPQQSPAQGQRYMPGGKPQSHHAMPPQNPQGQPDFRRPPAPMSQPSAPYFPAASASAQQMPSPGSMQRSRHNAAQPQPPNLPPSSNSHHHQSQQRHAYPPGHHHSQQHSGSQFPFAPHSLEATASKRAMAIKRPRTFARDFAWAPQRRLMMSLRSGMESDFVWAMNALTAFLYDDTQQPLRLDQAEPQLLGVLVEHLRATLALLYPQVDFNVNAAKMVELESVYEVENEKLVKLDEDSKLLDMEVDVENDGKRQKMSPVVVKNLPATAGKLPTALSISSILAPSTSSTQNFTLKTRTDRQVKVEVNSKKPTKLQRLCDEQNGETFGEGKDVDPAQLRLQMELGQGSTFADRIYRSLRSRVVARRALTKPVYSLADRLKQGDEKEATISNGVSIDDGYNSDHENKTEEQIKFYYRRPYSHEVWDRFAQPDCSLLPRLAPLNERDPVVQELVDRAVCLSNLIRGLAFVPINCRFMHSHKALLNICSKLLMLCVKEDEQQRKARCGKSEKEMKIEQTEEELLKDSQTNNNDEEPTDEQQKPRPTTIDDHFNADDSTKFRVKQCGPEQDGNDKLLLETANLLRDDAFVVLSQLSVHLDLYGMESEISYPLLDSLIHWAVTTNIQAQDPIVHPGAISPRAYVFEIISKLSLLDKNIDLLLSTGSWPRMEEFVRVVCNCITMSEELPLREFAIVILQAISVASEPICIVATMQTQVVQNLISFLEIADQAMTTIAANDGLTALRDNTERIGTSIGMLRRAIQILYNFVQYEPCRPYFVRYQEKLLSFTVSSIMDSRVAITAASILYDIQSIPNDLPERRELNAEDYKNLSSQFRSCSWRLNDSDEKLEDSPMFSSPSFALPSSQNCQGMLNSMLIGQPILPNESMMNGTDPIALNGNSKPQRKRVHQHEDGRELTELEMVLFRDSDAESIEGDDVNDSQPSEHRQSPDLDKIQQNSHQHHQTPTNNELSRRTVSDSVKEKLHNHIMKHEQEHEEAIAQEDGPDAKRQKVVGNGMLTTPSAPPKCNGDLNNAKRPPTTTTSPQQAKTENGTTGNGSMTAVA